MFPFNTVNISAGESIDRSQLHVIESTIYRGRADADQGSSIERSEVNLRARVNLERPPGGRPHRPRQYVVRLKLARIPIFVVRIERRTRFPQSYSEVRSEIMNQRTFKLIELYN